MQQNWFSFLYFDASTCASIASAIAAVLALVFSVRSNRISKRAFELAQLQEARLAPSLSPYLANAYYGLFKQHSKDRFYAFNLTISNSSASANSIVNLELHIVFATLAKQTMKLKIPVSYDVAKYFPRNIDMLKTPIKLDPYQAISGWCYFAVKQQLFANKHIEGYELVIIDANNTQRKVNCSIVSQFVERKNVRTQKEIKN